MKRRDFFKIASIAAATPLVWIKICAAEQVADNGVHVTGYLVRFGDPDTDGTFFTPETRFGYSGYGLDLNPRDVED